MSTMVQASGGGGKSKLNIHYYGGSATSSSDSAQFIYTGIGCYCDDMQDPAKEGFISCEYSSNTNKRYVTLIKGNNIQTRSATALPIPQTENLQYAENNLICAYQNTTQPSSTSQCNIIVYYLPIAGATSSFTLKINLAGTRGTNSVRPQVDSLYIFKKPNNGYKVFIGYHYMNAQSQYVSEFAVFNWTGEFNASAFSQVGGAYSLGSASQESMVNHIGTKGMYNMGRPFVVKVNNDKWFMLPIYSYYHISNSSLAYLYPYKINSDTMGTSISSLTGSIKNTEICVGSGRICVDEDTNRYLVLETNSAINSGKINLIEYQDTVTSVSINRTILNRWIITDFTPDDIMPKFGATDTFQEGGYYFGSTLTGKLSDLSGCILLYWTTQSTSSYTFPTIIKFEHASNLIPVASSS